MYSRLAGITEPIFLMIVHLNYASFSIKALLCYSRVLNPTTIELYLICRSRGRGGGRRAKFHYLPLRLEPTKEAGETERAVISPGLEWPRGWRQPAGIKWSVVGHFCH